MDSICNTDNEAARLTPAPRSTFKALNARLALPGISVLGYLLKSELLSDGCYAQLSAEAILLRVMMTFALSTWAWLSISRPSTEYKCLATPSALRPRDPPIYHDVLPSSPIPRSPECAKACHHDFAQPVDDFLATTVDSRTFVDSQEKRSSQAKANIQSR